jgi:subtilisin family serine protease
MKTLRLMIGAAVAVTGLAMTSAADAAPHGIRVGEITCNVASGWGFVFGSSKDLRCTYRGANGHREHYTGAISKFGVDIGYTEGGVLVWGVFAPTSDMRKGALAGDYVGASAQATVAVGVGANALIGGFDKSIALQPLSVEGSKGLNVAAGIGSITLREAP